MNKRSQQWVQQMTAQNRDGYFIAVADLEQDARATFLKKVYSWFFAGVFTMIASAAVGFLVIVQLAKAGYAQAVFSWGWIAAIIIWMIASFTFQRMLLDKSKATFALFGYNILLGFVVSFMAVLAVAKTGNAQILWMALGLTGLVFAGLTATVMFTKGDFSFLRGFISVGFMIGLGLVGMSIISAAFGLNLFGGGIWGWAIPVFFVLLLSGSILYTTSEILHRFPEDMYISAAAMLSIDFGVLLYYILMILMRDR